MVQTLFGKNKIKCGVVERKTFGILDRILFNKAPLLAYFKKRL